jgi:hypothetical protein
MSNEPDLCIRQIYRTFMLEDMKASTQKKTYRTFMVCLNGTQGWFV